MSGTVLTKDRNAREFRRPMPIGGHQYPAVFHRVWRAISCKLNGIAEARRMARAHDELAAMSDPELQDIGINRADIPAVACGGYYRMPHSISDLASSGR